MHHQRTCPRATLSRQRFAAEVFPTNCPICGSPIEVSDSGKSAKCVNPDCGGRQLARMVNMFAKLINTDKIGYIIANENCHTNVDGIFVAGDNRTKSLRQLVTATSDGAIAATEAIKYINKK